MCMCAHFDVAGLNIRQIPRALKSKGTMNGDCVSKLPCFNGNIDPGVVQAIICIKAKATMFSNAICSDHMLLYFVSIYEGERRSKYNLKRAYETLAGRRCPNIKCWLVGVGLEAKSSTYPKDRIFAFKFSRSPYFDNHLSESILTCTMDTLYG